MQCYNLNDDKTSSIQSWYSGVVWSDARSVVKCEPVIRIVKFLVLCLGKFCRLGTFLVSDSEQRIEITRDITIDGECDVLDELEKKKEKKKKKIAWGNFSSYL